MKWISAKDEMPERYIDVLGYFPNGTEEGKKVAMAYANSDSVQSASNTSTAYCFIATHWMPLPEPPKEKE